MYWGRESMDRSSSLNSKILWLLGFNSSVSAELIPWKPVLEQLDTWRWWHIDSLLHKHCHHHHHPTLGTDNDDLEPGEWAGVVWSTSNFAEILTTFWHEILACPEYKSVAVVKSSQLSTLTSSLYSIINHFTDCFWLSWNFLETNHRPRKPRVLRNDHGFYVPGVKKLW